MYPGQYYIPQGAGLVGQPVNNGGPGTPTKQGQQMAPSVVISPSAPVSFPFIIEAPMLWILQIRAGDRFYRSFDRN